MNQGLSHPCDDAMAMTNGKQLAEPDVTPVPQGGPSDLEGPRPLNPRPTPPGSGAPQITAPGPHPNFNS
jgi:hypothetical protein